MTATLDISITDTRLLYVEFKKFITDELHFKKEILNQFLTNLKAINYNDYRNLSAHTEPINAIAAADCKALATDAVNELIDNYII